VQGQTTSTHDTRVDDEDVRTAFPVGDIDDDTSRSTLVEATERPSPA